MGFESIFSKSWGEFKKNISLALKSSWWFFILPALVILLIITSMVATILIQTVKSLPNESIGKDALTITGNAIGSSSAVAGGIFITIIILLVVFTVFFIINQIVILYAAIFNEKGGMKLKQATKGALSYFWKFLGLTLLILILLSLITLIPISIGILILILLRSYLFIAVPLFLIFCLLGIVLCIYFSIKWSFSVFVLLREKTKIIEALKRSSVIVRGRWWKVLGYLMLFSLIASGISFVVSIIMQMMYLLFLGLMFMSFLFGAAGFAIAFFIFVGVIAAIYGLMTAVINLAVFLLVKNFYLELRTEKIKK